MTLGQFEAGGGWEAQIRQYVRKKYRQDLAGLAAAGPRRPWPGCCGGEVLPGRPYATIRWVLRLKPFRPLELYLLFDLDPEFGADLRVFYARKSLAVPTEDAYVFAWDFVALLARYGRGDYAWQEAGPGPEWLSCADFASAAAGPMQEVSLGAREEVLPLLTPEVVEVALRRLDCGDFCRPRRRLAGGLAHPGGLGLPLPDGGRRRRDGLRQPWGPEIRAGISHQLLLALPQRPAAGVPAGGPIPAAIVPLFLEVIQNLFQAHLEPAKGYSWE